MKFILLPWLHADPGAAKQTKKKAVNGTVNKEERWKLDWTYAVEVSCWVRIVVAGSELILAVHA